MRVFFLIIGLVMFSTMTYTQDYLVRKNGSEIKCKILHEDSVKVYFIITENDQEIETFLNKDLILEIIYENKSNQLYYDSIYYQKEPGSIQFYRKGLKLDKQELSRTLTANPQASEEYKKAIDNQRIAAILGFIGGVMTGWTIGEIISRKEEVNWTVLGIGGGLIIITTLIDEKSKKQVINAVDIYNQGVKRHQ